MFRLIGLLFGLIVAILLLAFIIVVCVAIVFIVAVMVGVITDKKNWAIRVIEQIEQQM